LQDAEPMAWDLALRAAEGAAASWRRCAEHAGELAAVARRNGERALRRLAELRARKAAAEQQRQSQKEQAPPPEVPPPSPETELAAPDLATAELAPAEVARLRQRLQQKEREKRGSRLAAQRDAAVVGERGW
jgi:hypothetical protein